jgi:hypothetical protein
MATKSPLFQSAMELLGHSVTHFVGREELDRKLFILHVSNAVELLLKDVLLDTGASIYKNPKETITIQGCIEALRAAQVTIPYINKIELLIDERNALQHRFGSPNELTTIFYQAIAFDFFREILRTHYDLDLDEVLEQFADEKDLAALRLGQPSDDTELDKLKKYGSVHPLGALLAATTYLEKILTEFFQKIGIEDQAPRRPPWITLSHRRLELFGITLPDQLREEMDRLRNIRNLATHGRKEPTVDDVTRSVDTIEKLEQFLNALDLEKTKETVSRHLAERQADLARRGLIIPHETVLDQQDKNQQLTPAVN